MLTLIETQLFIAAHKAVCSTKQGSSKIRAIKAVRQTAFDLKIESKPWEFGYDTLAGAKNFVEKYFPNLPMKRFS